MSEGGEGRKKENDCVYQGLGNVKYIEVEKDKNEGEYEEVCVHNVMEGTSAAW